MSNRNRSKTRQYRGPVPVASTQRIVAYSPSRGVLYWKDRTGIVGRSAMIFMLKRGRIPTQDVLVFVKGDPKRAAKACQGMSQ